MYVLRFDWHIAHKHQVSMYLDDSKLCYAVHTNIAYLYIHSTRAQTNKFHTLRLYTNTTAKHRTVFDMVEIDTHTHMYGEC